MTKFGRSALTRLANLNTLAWFIPADNTSFKDRLHNAHEARKSKALEQMRAMMEPHLDSSVNVENKISYTGKDGAELNSPYTQVLDKFVAESVLCSCVDTYHWYLRRVVEESLIADKARIRTWKEPLNLTQ